MGVNLNRRGQVWWVDYRHEGQRVRRSLGTKNRKIAEEMRVELEFRLLRGEPTEEARERVSVAQALAEYGEWARANKSPKTWLNDEKRLRSFLSTVGATWLDEIRTPGASRFLSQRALAGLAPATVLRYREIAHAFCEFAVRMGYLDRNPVSAVPRPRLPEMEPVFLSLEQIDAVLSAVEGDVLGPLVATAIYAGLRREELCWLTTEDVSIERDSRLLRVRSKTVDGLSWVPKTGKNRWVPISDALWGRIERCVGGGAGWLFPSPGNRRWDPDNLSRRLRRVLRGKGVPFGFLVFRHTFGSQLARKGTSLLKIAQLMGNSPEIARRHYIHLAPEEMAADVEFV